MPKKKEKVVMDCAFTVEVLGTPYQVMVAPADQADLVMSELHAGEVDFYAKTIKIRRDVDIETVYTHELIHAFLFESGLHTNSDDIVAWALHEEMVDYFALQWPKINKAKKYGLRMLRKSGIDINPILEGEVSIE